MNGNHKSDECIFCRAVRDADGPENQIVWRGEHAFIILNRFPYNSGHVMVVPFQHVESIEGLDDRANAEVMALIIRIMKALRAIYRPQGFNIGANIGEAAGAGIAGHVHIHIVPRWNGDTNFMTTIGDTRVLPETLEDTYQRIQEELLKSE